jgi:flagellar L-ring protein precursor FlgH
MRYLLILFFVLSGCSSIKESLGMKKDDSDPAQDLIASVVKYSDTPQAGVAEDRKYRSRSKRQLEDESDVGSQAGSMWSMEGQTSYLFAQNKSRREGDALKVNLDSVAMKQIESKVAVIKTLLKQIEEQKKAELARRNGTAEGDAKEAKAEAKPKEDEKQNLDDVKSVPSQVVEKLSDGNYRLKGSQPFMIGSKEYKVIVTGIIRPEDYNDEGVSSAKLLASHYDVVSIRRGGADE